MLGNEAEYGIGRYPEDEDWGYRAQTNTLRVQEDETTKEAVQRLSQGLSDHELKLAGIMPNEDPRIKLLKIIEHLRRLVG